MKKLRVAIVSDYPEEGWPSMDLVALMLRTFLGRKSDEVEAVDVCPPYRARLARLPIPAGLARNADRLANRYLDYPRHLRALDRRERFDIYHVADHSYAQVVHALPADRVVVTCHDLDTFRCLLEPEVEPRPRWFRALTKRTLAGLSRAALVSAGSGTTEANLLRFGLVDADRLILNYTGTNPEFFEPPDPAKEAEADRLLASILGGRPPFLLHVGSNIPRKRIDVLLDTYAGVVRERPEVRLVKIGGEFTPSQRRRAEGLGVLDRIGVIPLLRDRRLLASIYRRAALVLQPSEAEGFGLPIAEAMACGAPVLASDIPVLREIGGDALVYEPVGAVSGWVGSALALLGAGQAGEPSSNPRRQIGLDRAQAYRWETHVDRLIPRYRAIADRADRADSAPV